MMAYKRKTQDIYEIQGHYGSGWEAVTEETTFSDARQMLKDYNDNETQYPHRIRKRRELIPHKCSFRWSGNMPNTGLYCCVTCGKPEDSNSFDGKGK